MGLFKLFKRGVNEGSKNRETTLQKTIKNINGVIDRTKIPSEEIDMAQRISASPSYCSRIIKRYYYDYPIKPFISKDRELYTNWLEQVTMFPNMLLKRENMLRFPDGLLPGHVYMLYWLSKYSLNRRIPVYFEYEYGIEFMTELQWLKEEGFVDKLNKPTQNGERAIRKHLDVIEKRNMKQNESKTTSSKQKFRSPNQIAFESVVDDIQKAIVYEKTGDIDKAIKIYESCVAKRFEGNHPYDRLAIIYHRQKRYDDEKRVLVTAIDVFTNDVNKARQDRIPKLNRFKKRLSNL